MRGACQCSGCLQRSLWLPPGRSRRFKFALTASGGEYANLNEPPSQRAHSTTTKAWGQNPEPPGRRVPHSCMRQLAYTRPSPKSRQAASGVHSGHLCLAHSVRSIQFDAIESSFPDEYHW